LRQLNTAQSTQERKVAFSIAFVDFGGRQSSIVTIASPEAATAHH
jgi:hypothetical protein